MASKRRQFDKTEEVARKCPKAPAKKNDDPDCCIQIAETGEDKELINHIQLACSREATPARLPDVFFEVPCIDLARALLGQHLVRMVGTQRVSGKIVETEAYMGLEDKAAHSYKGKRTERNKAMFMQPGTAYVYNIYGMYCCLNISSQGDGCAVLLRALEPIENINIMRDARGNKSGKKQKDKEMTNGPSKLCQALQISKLEFNMTDLISSNLMWLEQGDAISSDKIICCPRINIGYAEDWKLKPLRFYVLGNECVSVRDKVAEAESVKSSCLDQ